jgi:hypothetical protein
MVRGCALGPGTTVTIKLKSKNLKMLDGKRVDDVLVEGTWIDFLRKNFNTVKSVRIVDAIKCYFKC